MKNTRTYIINLRKLIFCSAAILLVLSLIAASGVYLTTVKVKKIILTYSMNIESIKHEIPILDTRDSHSGKVDFRNVLSFILNEDIESPTKIIAEKIAFIQTVKSELSEQYSFVNESNNYYIPKVIEGLIKEEKQEEIAYNPAIEKTIKSIKKNGSYLEQMGITFDNKTSYAIDANALYKGQLSFGGNKDKPAVLIIHTHGSESYNPTDRNQDINQNIVKVGAEMAKVFEENDIKVYHSEKMHDIPLFNNSYKNSLVTVNDMLQKYQDIGVVLDVHRDAMISESGEAYKVVKEIDGVKMSQVMFVVGTNEGGLSHDGWRENLKFAIKCQKRINELAPDIARPINIRQERFNQHTTNSSVIIEIGTNGNTLMESINSGRIAAKAIADVINSN